MRFILLVILSTVLARAFWRLMDGVIQGVSGRPPGTTTPQRGVEMVRDPVCGTFVVPANAVTLADGPRRLHFCSTSCRDRYRARTA